MFQIPVVLLQWKVNIAELVFGMFDNATSPPKLALTNSTVANFGIRQITPTLR